MKIIVPAYFHASSSYWTFLIAQASAVEYAIINPASGPGTVKELAYSLVVAQAQARGVSILGYVATTYAAKAPSVVQGEMNHYRDWYGVDGFFFDEAASTPDKLDYYAGLYASTKGVVILNPGVYPHKAYVECADVLCVEERPVEVTETRSESLTRWMDGQPPEKFYYIIHAVANAARMRRTIKRAKERNVGYVYITNDSLPNPFDTLPIYWDDEAKFVTES
jgi:hypothetical protein